MKGRIVRAGLGLDSVDDATEKRPGIEPTKCSGRTGAMRTRTASQSFHARSLSPPFGEERSPSTERKVSVVMNA